MSLFSVSLVSFWNSQDLNAEQVQRFLGPSSNNSGLLSFECKSHGLEGSFFQHLWSEQSSLEFEKYPGLKSLESKSCGLEGPISSSKKIWITNPVLKKIGLQGPICLEKNYGFDSPQCALGCIAPKSLGWSAHFLVYCRSMGWSPSVFWKSMDGRVQLYCKKNGLKSPVLSFKVSSLENLECEIVDWRVQFYCSTSMDWTAQFWISKVLDWRTHSVFTKLWAGEPNDFWKNTCVSVRSFWTRTWALQSTGFQNQNAFCFLNKDVVLFSKNKTSHDITWRPLKIHENPCKPMKTHEGPWKPMKPHKEPWGPMNSHDLPKIPWK